MKKMIELVLALMCILCLVACDNTSTTEEQRNLISMVMVDGVLYLDTGHTNTNIRKCGTPDGQITTMVDGSEKPTVDNQSNFGIGYGYQYGATEGTIEIYMNDKWCIFATEEVGQQIQFPNSDDSQKEPYVLNIYDSGADTEVKNENDEYTIFVKYYEMSDGTWKTDDYTYQYRLEITGRMPNAVKDMLPMACHGMMGIYLKNMRRKGVPAQNKMSLF